MALPWLITGTAFLSLFAFIPLLFVGDYFANNRNRFSLLKYAFIIYSGLSIWTLCSVWWLVNSTFLGLLIALFFYPLCMTVPFVLSQVVRQKSGAFSGYFSLIVFLISIEWLTLNFDFAWPWLVLGNAFARLPIIVQWYEYTGVLGGSLWILFVNVLTFQLIHELIGKNDNQKSIQRMLFIIVLVIIVIPVSYSVYRYKTYKEKGVLREWVIVQPNINSYTEKFSGMSSELQVSKMLKLADSLVDMRTSVVVLPETAIPQSIFEEDLENNNAIKQLQSFIDKHPGVIILCGAITQQKYNRACDGLQNFYSVKGKQGNYVQYNTALCISRNKIQIYRKSKLLPGVETMPFAKYIPSINKLLFNFGGQGGSFGTQTERTVFIINKLPMSAIVCYEAEFGAYVGEFTRNGAQIIALMTNDGWWGNTPGYKQHLSFSRLRALELRRDIPRSANTGISCVVNQRGDVLHQTVYGVADAKKVSVSANSQCTFYAQQGDYIGLQCLWLSFLFLFGLFLKKWHV